MNVLVVDDELYANKALAKIVKDWNPDAVVTEASNGQEAMERIAAVPPDLVFTDIRMPLKNGLELVAHLHEHVPRSVNVIVSGYDDFAFAQQAMRYKVEHYLLKPVDPEQVRRILEQVRRKLEEERFAACLHEEAGHGASPAWTAKGTAWALAIIHVDAAACMPQVRAIAASVLKPSGIRHVMTDDKRYNGWTIIGLFGTEEGSPDEWAQRFRALLGDIAERCCGAIAPKSVRIGMSRIHTAPGEIKTAYLQAKHALLRRLLDARGGAVFSANDAASGCRHRYAVMERQVASITRNLLENRYEVALDTLRRLFEPTALRQLSVPMFTYLCAKLTAALHTAAEQIVHADHCPKRLVAPVDLHDFSDISAVADYFAAALGEMAECLSRQRQDEDIVDAMIRYVRMHYDQPIVLEDLARNVYYMDPDYLSRIFKKRTGMRFSRFLLAERMRIARAMLESDSQLTISEVSGAVGFNDCSYFIRIYKRHFGETPGKSKRNKARHHPSVNL